jgi:hypothetical protein
MNATDVKAVCLAAIHGSGQGLLYTQAQVDQMATDYAAGKPLDAIVAEIVSAPYALKWGSLLRALVANGLQSVSSLRALLGDPHVG